jgi:hypothetical protein
MIGLPAEMNDLRTATLVRNIDSTSLPSREKCISTIKTYIWSKDLAPGTAALVLAKLAKSKKFKPKEKVPCFAC